VDRTAAARDEELARVRMGWRGRDEGNKDWRSPRSGSSENCPERWPRAVSDAEWVIRIASRAQMEPTSFVLVVPARAAARALLISSKDLPDVAVCSKQRPTRLVSHERGPITQQLVKIS
jgi:hypothetical protein